MMVQQFYIGQKEVEVVKVEALILIQEVAHQVAARPVGAHQVVAHRVAERRARAPPAVPRVVVHLPEGLRRRDPST